MNDSFLQSELTKQYYEVLAKEQVVRGGNHESVDAK